MAKDKTTPLLQVLLGDKRSSNILFPALKGMHETGATREIAATVIRAIHAIADTTPEAAQFLLRDVDFALMGQNGAHGTDLDQAFAAVLERNPSLRAEVDCVVRNTPDLQASVDTGIVR